MKMLIQLLIQPETEPQQLFVKTGLMVRDTVAKI
jgi:LacI family transcriptional regulator